MLIRLPAHRGAPARPWSASSSPARRNAQTVCALLASWADGSPTGTALERGKKEAKIPRNISSRIPRILAESQYRRGRALRGCPDAWADGGGLAHVPRLHSVPARCNLSSLAVPTSESRSHAGARWNTPQPLKPFRGTLAGGARVSGAAEGEEDRGMGGRPYAPGCFFRLTGFAHDSGSELDGTRDPGPAAQVRGDGQRRAHRQLSSASRPGG